MFYTVSTRTGPDMGLEISKQYSTFSFYLVAAKLLLQISW